MIRVIITSFKEPKTIGKSIESFLKQTYKDKYEIIVSVPDEETIKVVNGYVKKHKRVKLFKDPGRGKSFALNLVFKKYKDGVLILTDGDVFVNEVTIEEIMKLFDDKKIGCVAGRVVSINKKDNMLGYWSHLLADAGAHKIRKLLSKQNKFLECSGYLFAFRAGIIKSIPVDVAEDSIVPYLFYKKGYKLGYASRAEVYVKNPTNLKDFFKQRVRTIKAHTKLNFYHPNFPNVKSFINESKGLFWALCYPRSIKEIYWTILLIPTRLLLWLNVFYEEKIKKQPYQDAWDRIESTK